MGWFCFSIKRKQKTLFPINDLPSELVVEIFYKLPVKQLHRNKIVCKRWSSLISHPSFASQFSLRGNPPISPAFTLFLTLHHMLYCFHSKHLTNNGESWFIGSKNPFKFIPGSGRRWRDIIICLASSNGLVLCSTTKYLCRCVYYVVNPMTKQWITLPSPPSCKNFVLSGFVCNPNYGTEFKVVRLIQFQKYSRDFSVEIFDSATNQWKVFKKKITSLMSFFDEINAIEHGGILYWECRNNDLVIITFNPNDNNFDVFPLPGTSYHFDVKHKLGVSQNHLYYTEIDFRSGDNNRSTIWRCDELEGKRIWTVHHDFDLYDWTLLGRFNKLSRGPDIDHIDHLRNSFSSLEVLGIDPVNCNILYLSLRLKFFDECKDLVYSMDTQTREMKRLSSASSVIVRWSLTFVHPNWPTAIPNPRLPSPDENTQHPAAICQLYHDIDKS